MSDWIDNADLLATHLQTAAGEGVPVIVFRALDIEAAANSNVGKASGRCFLITWLGGENPNRDSRNLSLGSEFSISLWSRPDLAPAYSDSHPDPDSLAQKVAAAAHGWQPAHAALHPLAPSRLEVVSVRRVPNGKYYVVEIRAEIARLLPIPPTPPPAP